MSTPRILWVLMIGILVASLAACGGGGSKAPTGLTISGTASQGAPLTGAVTLKDSKGATATGAIDPATGAYSITVDGMTAPFILRAGNYYAAAPSAARTNINPLTHLCVSNAAGASTPDQVFADVTKLAPVVTRLTGIVDDLKSHLDRLYPASVPSTQRDFMNGALTIDQGVDLVLSRITITSNAAGFTIRYDDLPIVSGSVGGNGSVVVTSNGTYLGYAANNVFGTSPTYSFTDLQGTWYLFQFLGGTTNPYWAKATLTVNGQGAGILSDNINAHGRPGSTTTVQMAIDSAGVISVSGSLTKMNLSSDKTLAIGTGGDADEESLYVLVKAGSGFRQSDLTGSWKFHSLVASSTSRDWQRGDIGFSSSGASTITNITKGSGSTGSGNNFTLGVAANGAVTAPSGFPVDFFGAMTRDKNLFVATWSNSDGTYGIGFFVRRGLVNASMVDLVGTWKIHSLALSPTQSEWSRYLNSISWTESNRSQIITNGMSRPDESSIFPNQNIIDPDGIFTGGITKEGILSLSRNMLIQTNSAGDSMMLSIGMR